MRTFLFFATCVAAFTAAASKKIPDRQPRQFNTLKYSSTQCSGKGHSAKIGTNDCTTFPQNNLRSFHIADVAIGPGPGLNGDGDEALGNTDCRFEFWSGVDCKGNLVGSVGFLEDGAPEEECLHLNGLAKSLQIKCPNE